MDTARLTELIEREGVKKVPLVVLKVTKNSGGGRYQDCVAAAKKPRS